MTASSGIRTRADVVQTPMTTVAGRLVLARGHERYDVRDLGDSLVIFDLETRQTFALQPPASTVFASLIAEARAGAGVDQGDLLAATPNDQVKNALAELQDSGLITVHDR